MDKELSSIHYDQYLQLSKILDAQKLRSKEFKEAAHDEMLFIIVHQVMEAQYFLLLVNKTVMLRLANVLSKRTKQQLLME